MKHEEILNSATKEENLTEKERIIREKRKTTVDEPDYKIAWEGQPAGIWERFLSMLHLNFTWYKISTDELIITTGFFNRRTDSIELYLLKDPDITESLIQRWLGVGNIKVIVDSRSTSARAGSRIILKNIKKPNEVRKMLRDYIEADVLERGINYFDKV